MFWSESQKQMVCLLQYTLTSRLALAIYSCKDPAEFDQIQC